MGAGEDGGGIAAIKALDAAKASLAVTEWRWGKFVIRHLVIVPSYRLWITEG